MQIILKNLRFYAYHGLHSGEEILGGEYEVNVTVNYNSQQAVIKNISEIIDYTQLYQLIKSKMETRRHLLETVATEMAGEIIAEFSLIEAVEISIFKLYPPIEKFEGSVGVTFKLSR